MSNNNKQPLASSSKTTAYIEGLVNEWRKNNYTKGKVRTLVPILLEQVKSGNLLIEGRSAYIVPVVEALAKYGVALPNEQININECTAYSNFM